MDYRAQKRTNAATIYPVQDHGFTIPGLKANPNITDDMKRSVENGTNVIVDYGTIYYGDTFNKHWATDFCFYFLWSDISARGWHECINRQGADDESEGDFPK